MTHPATARAFTEATFTGDAARSCWHYASVSDIATLLLIGRLVEAVFVQTNDADGRTKRGPARPNEKSLLQALRVPTLAQFIHLETRGGPLADGLGARLAFRARQSLNVAC